MITNIIYCKPRTAAKLHTVYTCIFLQAYNVNSLHIRYN